MLSSSWLRPALLGLVLAVAACVPQFANPLVGGDKADAILLGKWTGKSSAGEKPMPLEITAEGDGVAVLMTDADDPSKPETMKLIGTTATVGGVHYLNLTPTGPDAPPGTGMMIFRYAPQPDGTILAWHLDEKIINAAVESGKLAGTMTGGQDKSANVTASSDELAAFFASTDGQAAFSSGTGDVLVLTRTAP